MATEPVPEECQKLRDLSAKIQQLMKDADVAGIINLQGKEFAEFAIVIDPSWSLLRWETQDGELMIRFRAKLKSGSPEEKEMGRLTIGLLDGLRYISNVQSAQIEKMLDMIKTKADVESTFTTIPR